MQQLKSLVIFCLLCSCVVASDALLPAFEAFDEQVRWTRLESGVRVFVNARRELSTKPRRLVIFATPNSAVQVADMLGASLLASPRSWLGPRSLKHRRQLRWLSIRDAGIVDDGLVWMESVVSAEGCALQSLLCQSLVVQIDQVQIW